MVFELNKKNIDNNIGSYLYELDGLFTRLIKLKKNKIKLSYHLSTKPSNFPQYKQRKQQL